VAIGTLEGVSASDNLVEGNYIGTDVTGATALPNSYYGVSSYFGSVFLQGIDGNSEVSGNTIADNLISDNNEPGVLAAAGYRKTRSAVRAPASPTSLPTTKAMASRCTAIRRATPSYPT